MNSYQRVEFTELLRRRISAQRVEFTEIGDGSQPVAVGSGIRASALCLNGEW